MTTHFDMESRSIDIFTGHHRKLNLLHPPFSFPTPLEFSKESTTENGLDDRFIGLWIISDSHDLKILSSSNE